MNSESDNFSKSSTLKKTLKSIIILCASQVATTLVAIIRNKVLAVILGPSGVGLIAQLTTAQNFISSVVPMGMQVGTISQLCQLKSQSLIAQCIATSQKVFFWLSMITTVVCLIFIKPITSITLGTNEFFLYMIPMLLGVPFLIQSNVWQSYLLANLEIKIYSKIGILTSFIGLIIVVPMVLIWGLWGAIINVLFIAAINYIIYAIYANKTISTSLKAEIKSAPFNVETFKILRRFGWANLPVLALDLGIPFLIRIQIIRDLGLTSNGIYQAVLAISGALLTMPFNALTTYSFPTLSKLSDYREINGEVNTFSRLLLLICTFSCLIVLLFKDMAVQLLFSPKFFLAVGLLSWQVIGEFFKIVAMAIQLPLQPKERFKARNIINTLQKVVFIIILYLPPAAMRLEGAVWGYAASWFFTLFTAYLYTNRVNGFTFTRTNWRLFLTGTIAIFIIAFLPLSEMRWRIGGVILATFWTVTALSLREWQVFLRESKYRITKIISNA